MSEQSLELKKCSFFDTGYCKYGEKCKFKHFLIKCEISECENVNCSFRHPKPCKHRKKCKYFSKGICSYEHDTLAHDDAQELKAHKSFEEKIKQLEIKAIKNESDHQNQIKAFWVELKEQKKIIAEVIACKNMSEKKMQDNENKLGKMKNGHQEEIKILHIKIKDQEKTIEEKTSNAEKKSKAIEKKVEELNVKLEIVKTSYDNLKKENNKNKSEIEVLKIDSNDKITDVKNYAMDDAVKLIKKKNVITVDSMSFSKIIKENEAKNNIKTKICREKVGLSIIEASEKDCKSNEVKCNQCDFETNSEGKLILHEINNH